MWRSLIEVLIAVAHWLICGGSSMEMWWLLFVRNVVTHWMRCMVAHCLECGGSLVESGDSLVVTWKLIG